MMRCRGLALAAALACAAPRAGELEYLAPDQVPLAELLGGEIPPAAPAVRCALELSDSLARRGVGYHRDEARHLLTRENAPPLPPELSCSEFVWYVYTVCGVDLGDRHRNSRELAFAEHNYPRGMHRVRDGSIRPGDLLVYDFDPEELERGAKLPEGERAGHVVLVVSPEQRILVGSHGAASTPVGAPEGVGYRRARGDLSRWTEGRTLRATYRPRRASATLAAPEE